MKRILLIWLISCLCLSSCSSKKKKTAPDACACVTYWENCMYKGDQYCDAYYYNCKEYYGSYDTAKSICNSY